jgi:hypothetical protein
MAGASIAIQSAPYVGHASDEVVGRRTRHAPPPASLLRATLSVSTGSGMCSSE